jgi:hypothetical protein
MVRRSPENSTTKCNQANLSLLDNYPTRSPLYTYTYTYRHHAPFAGHYPQTNLSLYTISALLILDSDGARVLAKYYAPPHQSAVGQGLVADFGVGPGGPGMGLSTLKEQKAFEKSIWEKVKRGGGRSLFLSSSGSNRKDTRVIGDGLILSCLCGLFIASALHFKLDIRPAASSAFATIPESMTDL